MATKKNSNTDVLAKNLSVAQNDVEAKLKGVRDALTHKDLTKYNTGLATLKSAVKDYNKLRRKVEYIEFLKSESPVITAIRQFYIPVRKVKVETNHETGAISDVKIVDAKATVDLDEFCKFGSLPREWVTHASQLLDLLALRKTNLYSMKPSELADKTSFFIAKANDKKSGGTPDSNTQIVRMLQTLADELIFVDNGKGKNAYKCTNHDIMFVDDAITKFEAKEKCTISTMNNRQFQLVMVNVCAHMLGSAYKVELRNKKKNTATTEETA